MRPIICILFIQLSFAPFIYAEKTPIEGMGGLLPDATKRTVLDDIKVIATIEKAAKLQTQIEELKREIPKKQSESKKLEGEVAQLSAQTEKKSLEPLEKMYKHDNAVRALVTFYRHESEVYQDETQFGDLQDVELAERGKVWSNVNEVDTWITSFESEEPKNKDFYKDLDALKEAIESPDRLVAKLKDTEVTKSFTTLLSQEKVLVNKVLETKAELISVHPVAQAIKLAELKSKLASVKQWLESSVSQMQITERRWNFRAAQTLSAGMAAVTNRIDVLVRGAANKDEKNVEDQVSPFRLAFRAMMGKLEAFENDLATAKYNNDSNAIYEQMDAQTAANRFKKFFTSKGTDFKEYLVEEAMGRPNKLQLVVDYNWARYGELGWKAMPQNMWESFTSLFRKNIFETLGKALGSAASGGPWVDWLSGEQGSLKEQLRSLGNAGKFALEHPLMISEIAANLRLTQTLLSASRTNIIASLQSDISGVLQVATTRNMVIDSLLGNRVSLYSKKGENEPPIDKKYLRLYNFSWWAPYAAGAYLGAQGEVPPAKLMQMIPFFGEIATKIFGGAAGIGWTYGMKVAASNITRRNEVWANSLLSAIKTATQSDNPLEALKAGARYAVARKLLQETGNLLHDLNEGTFLYNFYASNIKCIGTNPKAALAGGAGGVLIGTVLAGAVVATAAAPLAIALGAGTGACWVFAKVADHFGGGPEKRKQERILKELESIDLEIGKGAARLAIKEAIESMSQADREEIAKELALNPGLVTARTLLKKNAKLVDEEGRSSMQRYIDKLYDLYSKKIDSKLEQKEIEQAKRIAANVTIVPNDIDDLAQDTPPYDAIDKVENLFKNLEENSSVKDDAMSAKVATYLRQFNARGLQGLQAKNAVREMKAYATELEIDQIAKTAAKKLPEDSWEEIAELQKE